MGKVEALFQGHSPTWCLLLRSFVSCEEDERSARAGASVSETREFMLKNNNFSFGE